MRKWLIFFLFPASLLLAQGEKAFDVKVPKGFANSYDGMNLSDDFATDAQNILFDSDLGAIKRSGYARDNGVSFGSQPVNGLYQFVNPQGNEYLMAISSNQLLYSIGGGTYTTVFSTINKGTKAINNKGNSPLGNQERLNNKPLRTDNKYN